ncbi:MAG TPA: GreA/GreB family elongation factor [Devosia sp.]|nr:GreA/GreB family elongation factor [Devosia sp.]
MGFFSVNLPSIMVAESDRHDLLVLAMGGTGHSADEADNLLYELGRARVVDDQQFPPDVVRMGSSVLVSIDGGEPQILRLSYPREQGNNRVSIFSAIGTALLGLRRGQTIKWTDRDGKPHEVAVYSVSDEEHG